MEATAYIYYKGFLIPHMLRLGGKIVSRAKSEIEKDKIKIRKGRTSKFKTYVI